MTRKLSLLCAVLVFAVAGAYAAPGKKDCRQLNPYYGAPQCKKIEKACARMCCDKSFAFGEKKAAKKHMMAKKHHMKMNAKKGKKECRALNPYVGAKQHRHEMPKCAHKDGCEQLNPYYGAPQCFNCKQLIMRKKGCDCSKMTCTAFKAPPPAPRKPAAHEELAKVATVQKTDKGTTRLSFNTPILFDTNSPNMQSVSKPEIAKIAKVLKEHKDVHVVVEGYTDSTGNAAYNVDLSERRAKSVADELIANGVQPANVSYKGYGAANPIASNDTKEGRAKNRRVELDITTK